MNQIVRYEFIHFYFSEQKPKTKVYEVYNTKSGSLLGEVRWMAGWRQYCFYPGENMVFSSGCLKDIIDFIKKLTAELREDRRVERAIK